MKLPLLLLPVLFILIAFPLIAQEDIEAEYEAEAETETQEDTDAADDTSFVEDRLYVITVFEFDITGRTRPSALMYNGEFKAGEKIKGQTNLEKYVSDKTQLLINQRVLKDNALVSYSVGEQAEDGSYPVTLTIKVEDSWNIIALPRPQYTSQTGFEMTIKARDYNFLGTMNPLRVDFGYRHDEKGNNSFQIEVYSDTPLRIFGYTWNIRFDNLFWYRPDVEQPFFYQNVSGLSMELPFRRTTFTFGFQESFNLNEEVSYRYQELYGTNFQNGLYMTSKLYTSWKIPTGLVVYRYGELTYTPEISATFNHELPDWPLLPFHKGPFLGFGHLLEFEKIDWHANYRKGLSVSIENNYSYNFFRLKNGDEPLSASLTFHAAGYFIISQFFGISSRLQYRHWFYHDPAYNEQAGDKLRGISDKSIHADYMLSLNMDFPLRVLLFTPSKWFNNRKLNFFDVELQIAPIIDLALYHSPDMAISFHPKNIAASSGIELIVFSDFMRNLYIRLGYAVNLRQLADKKGSFDTSDDQEIYLIMGHFY